MNNEDWINTFINKFNEDKDYKITDVRDREKLLDELRPKGEWIHHEQVNGLGGYWKCSCCGEPAIFTPRLAIDGVQNYGWDNRKTNFCPNCGAKMKGEEE